MAEASLHMFKHGQFQINPVRNAKTVVKLKGDRIEDHKQNQPHASLRQRSPRAFRMPRP